MWFLIVTLFPNVGPLGTLTGHFAALIIYPFLLLRYRINIPSRLKTLIVICFVFSVVIFLSILINHNEEGIGIGLIRYGLVPFYWIFGLLASIIDLQIFKKRQEGFLFKIASIFIIVQVPVVLTQLIGLDAITGIFWVADKARDWSQILRVVGTVQNPNTLGILTVLSIIIFVKNIKLYPQWSKIFVAIGIFIVFLTGSRTSLILLLILPLFHISKKQLLSRNALYIILFSIFALLLSYVLLMQLREQLPYLAQILDLVSGKSVYTLETRFSHWANVKETYVNASLGRILLGLGPGYFPVLDNSYFYILFNYGLLGFTSFALIVIWLFNFSRRANTKDIMRAILVLLVAGLVADLMISFLFMTIIFYLVGYKSKQLQLISISGNKRNDQV